MPPHRSTATRSSAATHGSATQLETTPLPPLPPTLRLRADSTDGRRIRWAEDVVDNEGMGKKKSKVCCIYHAPRAVGESSSEDDSSSSSDSDTDSGKDDSGQVRRTGGKKGRRRKKGEHDHENDHEHEHGCNGECKHSSKPAPVRRKKGRGNAYEIQPKGDEEGRPKA